MRHLKKIFGNRTSFRIWEKNVVVIKGQNKKN